MIERGEGDRLWAAFMDEAKNKEEVIRGCAAEPTSQQLNREKTHNGLSDDADR